MVLSTWMTALSGSSGITRTYATVDGAQMHYIEAGEGPPLVLVHGLLGTARHWEYAMPLLAEESHVYAPDALGIGLSDRVDGLDTGLLATASRLVAFLDALNIEKADWVGSSHGGAVVMMLAAHYPERVRSLVLHAPVNPFCAAADPLIHFYTTAFGRWFAHRVPSLPERLHRLALKTMYGDVSRLQLDSLAKYMTSLRVPGTIDYVLRILAGWKEQISALEGALPALREIPTLLLWGDQDRAVSPQSCRVLKQSFAHASSLMLPGAGHLAHEETPQAFGTAVNAFLRKQRSVAEEPAETVRRPEAA